MAWSLVVAAPIPKHTFMLVRNPHVVLVYSKCVPSGSIIRISSCEMLCIDLVPQFYCSRVNGYVIIVIISVTRSLFFFLLSFLSLSL